MPSNRAQSTRFLDALRAFAALWVVIFHCALWSGHIVIPPGSLAVDLFMIISGFLMVYTLERETAAGWVRRFYVRRYFRIAPAYYLTLAVMFFAQNLARANMADFQRALPEHWANSPYVAAGYHIGFTELLSHVSFLFGLLPSQADSTMLPDWSLSLEMQFYTLFPLLFLWSRLRPFLWIAIALSAACIFGTGIYGIGLRHGLWPAYPEPSLLLIKLPIFIVGMLIHEAKRRGRLFAIAALVLLALIEFRAAYWIGLSVVFFAGFLAWCWLLQLTISALESRFVGFLSDCSYSLYLVHMPVLLLAGHFVWVRLGAIAMTVTVVIISYAVSWVLFRTIEKPAIRVGKKLAHFPGPIAAPMT